MAEAVAANRRAERAPSLDRLDFVEPNRSLVLPSYQNLKRVLNQNLDMEGANEAISEHTDTAAVKPIRGEQIKCENLVGRHLQISVKETGDTANQGLMLTVARNAKCPRPDTGRHYCCIDTEGYTRWLKLDPKTTVAEEGGIKHNFEWLTESQFVQKKIGAPWRVVDQLKYIGLLAGRRFDKVGVVFGRVEAYLPQEGTEEALWHVSYEDGDEEDLNFAEVKAAVDLASRKRKSLTPGTAKWQTTGHEFISKRIRRRVCLEGQVVAFIPASAGSGNPSMWRVSFEDGQVCACICLSSSDLLLCY
jgi:hypothetical protein